MAERDPETGQSSSIFHRMAARPKVEGVSAPIPSGAADRRTFGLGAAEAHRPSYREPEEKPPSRLAEKVQPYLRAAELAGESITRGLSDTAGTAGTVVGAPVDLANWLINQARRATGAETVEEPAFGSAQLTRAFQAPFQKAIEVGGEVEPEGRAEEIAAMALESLGRNLPYAVAPVGAAGRLATAAPRAGKALTGRSAVAKEMLQKRLLGTPSEAVGIEKAIVGGTTLGAGAAEAVAPGDATVGIIGELGGGLAGGLRAGLRAGARSPEAHIPDIPTVKEASKARVKAQAEAVKEIGQAPPVPVEPQPSAIHRMAESDQGLIGAAKGLKGVAGSETTIKTTSGDYPVRYKVAELDDLIPSHDPQSFAEHPKYPKGVQERDYLRDKHAQMAVIKHADEYDPRFTVTNAPGPEHGPPVVGTDGIVYGGNSRVMSTSRVYAQGKGENYVNYLLAHADEFGLSPNEIRGMKNPVLVRELVDSPGTTRDAAALGSDLNKAFTRALSEQEQAVAAGRRLSQETQDSVANALGDLGDTATIRDLLRARPRDVLERLRADGVFSEEEITRFVDRATGAFNETGRDFVENLLLGSVIDNPGLLASSPKSILAKIERSIAPLARLRAKGGEWDISESVKKALEIHTSANARGVKLEDFLSQQGLFEGAPDPLAAAIARKLQGTQKSVKEAFSGMAEDAAADVKNQQAFGFRKVPTAQESILENLGAKIPKAEPTPSGTALVRKGIVPPKSKWHANDPTPIPASDRSRSKTAPVLNEVGHITGAARQPTSGPIRKWLATKKERLQQLFTAEFTPLRTAERTLYRMAGKKAPWLDMAREFEQVAGAPAKAQGDIIRFTEAVIDPLKEGRWFRQPARSAPVEGGGVLAETEGLTGAAVKKGFSVLDDFNSYLFLRRVQSRLTADPKQKRVANWSIEKAERGLQELHEKLGGEKFAMLERQGKVYQEHMDRALRLQVEAGKISEPVYQAIKKQNDFYAPFKLMRYLEDVEGGLARPIATTADLTKQIVGIDSQDFALSDFLIESVKQIYRSRILAEKNFKMLRLHDLAQIDDANIFFRKVRPDIFYRITHQPAEEILHQLYMQTTSRKPQLLEVSLTKVGKALEFAKESGLKVTRKIMADALGRAQLGGAADFNGKVWLNAFTSDVIAHELAHSFDTPMVDGAGNIIRNWKKVFGEDRRVIQRLSSAINDRDIHEGITGKKLRV